MTEDQIKAIAEVYATSDGVTNEIVADICEAFLYYLKDRYCIVEREKVMSLWRFCEDHEYMLRDNDIPPMKAVIASNKRMLTHLFGKEMLNKNTK